MNGIRLSLLPQGVEASAALAIASEADQLGIDGFWYGTLPSGRNVNQQKIDDTYVLTTLAGVAARTTDIRLGAILDLGTDPSLLTSVEDIGVVDQASGGRLEVALRPTENPGWIDRASAVVRGWNEWPTAGHDVVVTPRPAQPRLPWLVVRAGEAAGKLGAGGLVVGGLGHRGAGLDSRTVFALELLTEGQTLGDWLGAEPAAAVLALRDELDEVGADELVLILSGWRGGSRTIVDCATVLAPTLRCPRADIPLLVRDALRWNSAVRV